MVGWSGSGWSESGCKGEKSGGVRVDVDAESISTAGEKAAIGSLLSGEIGDVVEVEQLALGERLTRSACEMVPRDNPPVIIACQGEVAGVKTCSAKLSDSVLGLLGNEGVLGLVDSDRESIRCDCSFGVVELTRVLESFESATNRGCSALVDAVFGRLKAGMELS